MKTRLLKYLDASAGALACWFGGRWLYGVRSPVPSAGQPVRRILVVRPGGMGDMVLLLPLLRRVLTRYPEAVVDLVCERRNQDIPALAALPVQILLYDAQPLRTLLALRRRSYDLAIDSEQFHNFSAVMVWLSGAPVRIGFKINPGRNPIYTHLVNYDLTGYEADEFMRLLEPLGAGGQAVLAGSLWVEGPVPPRNPARVVMHTGASSRYKEWGAPRYAELVRQVAALLAEQGHPAEIVMVGSAREARSARDIAAQVGETVGVVIRAGSCSLAETAQLIGTAALFIGGDSGLAHLAQAVGTPSVVLFGPSDPEKWGGRGDANAVVRVGRSCSPCFIFGYHKPCRDIACMAEITVAQVMAGVRRVLLRSMSS